MAAPAQCGTRCRNRERARHVLVAPVFAEAAGWFRHFTQITGAPNDTWMRRTSDPCKWSSHRIRLHRSHTPPRPMWNFAWQRSHSEKKIDFLKTGMPKS